MATLVELALVAFFGVSALSLATLSAYLRSYPVEIRGIKSFTTLLVLMSVWSLSAVGKILLPSPVERVLVALELPFGMVFVIIFFVFASQYTGNDWHRQHAFAAYLTLSLGGLIFGILTNPFHGLFWTGIELSSAVFPHLVHERLGPLYFLYVAFAYGIYCLAVYLLLDLHLRSRYNTTSVVLIALGGSLPLLVNLVSVFDRAPIPGLDYTPIGLAAFGIATTWSIQTDFFDIVPLARDTAVEQSSEGMIILDANRCMRDFNPTAARLVPAIAQHRGESIERVFPDTTGWFDTPTDTTVHVEPQHENDLYLSVQLSAITDGPHHLGWILVLSDVSEQQRRERHLQLVSRVLRHNMANRINTIIGHAELLESTAGSNGRDHLEAIDNSATSIIETSGKLRTIQEIVTADRPVQTTDISGTVRAVAGTYTERYPDATVTVECPDGVSARCQIGFQSALDNLVENAIEHNTSQSPSVTVRVTVDEQLVYISVADDGPGIPKTEQRVLEEGETPLKHSSGVGLWLVYCFVEQSGHHLTFEPTPSGGSDVQFSLDRASTTNE